MDIRTLDVVADEGSTYFVTITFKDEDGVLVTPNSATWSLNDGDGTVINSRSDVAISTPASVEIIELGGADLLHSGGAGLERIILTIEAVYDTTKKLNSAVHILVRNLIPVS